MSINWLDTLRNEWKSSNHRLSLLVETTDELASRCCLLPSEAKGDCKDVYSSVECFCAPCVASWILEEAEKQYEAWKANGNPN